MEALSVLFSAVLWGMLLFAQHVVCFDIFDSNLWYLYLLALIVALAQMALLHRQRNHRILLTVCGLAYSALGVLKIPFTVFMVVWSPQSSWQLSLFCQILDLMGAARCFWLVGTVRKKVIS